MAQGVPAGTRFPACGELLLMAQVFQAKDRECMTPCMVAYEKWWNEQGKKLGVPTESAWIVFRNGWWASEESKEIA